LLRRKLTIEPIPPVTNSCCNCGRKLGVVLGLGKAMRRRDLIKGIAGYTRAYGRSLKRVKKRQDGLMSRQAGVDAR
jgi:hypothetical protein